MKRLLIFLILLLPAFSTGFSLNAQTKRQKAKKPAAGRQTKKITAPPKTLSQVKEDECLTSYHRPRPAVKVSPPTTPGGGLISDCLPLSLPVVYQPKVVYPRAAGAVKASGRVVVSVVVDETGQIIWAKVIEGHPLLRAEAFRVACGMRYKPPADCLGNPFMAYSNLYFNFKQ